jgi:putative FmdB family regulatory protein
MLSLKLLVVSRGSGREQKKDKDMALYEYECRTCGTVLELVQSVTSDNRRLLFCPKCRRIRSVKKLISKTSFILKGIWAKDGYARSKK